MLESDVCTIYRELDWTQASSSEVVDQGNRYSNSDSETGICKEVMFSIEDMIACSRFITLCG
jgi:hypothetical protein